MVSLVQETGNLKHTAHDNMDYRVATAVIWRSGLCVASAEPQASGLDCSFGVVCGKSCVAMLEMHRPY